VMETKVYTCPIGIVTAGRKGQMHRYIMLRSAQEIHHTQTQS
jgi:hypothetical protein